MPNRKITELPTTSNINGIVDVTILDDRKMMHRVILDDFMYTSEENAIEKIKALFKEGKHVIIFPAHKI